MIYVSRKKAKNNQMQIILKKQVFNLMEDRGFFTCVVIFPPQMLNNCEWVELNQFDTQGNIRVNLKIPQ